MESKRPIRRIVVGRVLSDKMDKTITVEREMRQRHAVYKKLVKHDTKIKAHDEKNEAKIGDIVKIIKCRPMSKEKSWRMVGIVEKAEKETTDNA